MLIHGARTEHRCRRRHTQEENDKQQLHPMLEQAEANRRVVGIEEETGVALADARYCSEENFTKTPASEVELLVATQKDYMQRKAMQDQPPPEEPTSDDLSPTELMERKLQTERGRRLYKIRGRTVEPVFVSIKEVRGFDRFMRRGIVACHSEWSLICATHNLLKLWRSYGLLELRKGHLETIECVTWLDLLPKHDSI